MRFGKNATSPPTDFKEFILLQKRAELEQFAYRNLKMPESMQISAFEGPDFVPGLMCPKFDPYVEKV
jgi:hypothetical protein